MARYRLPHDAVEGIDYIQGRPDFRDPMWGRTFAKTFPPYVFSINGNACLIQKIVNVEISWWDAQYDILVRRQRPTMIAHTACGCSRFLTALKTRTCRIPAPDAVLCGRCHGEPSSYGPHGNATKARIPKSVAKVKLGCVVKGY